MSLKEIYSLYIDEAVALVWGLGQKTDTYFFTKLNKWEYVISQEGRILADIYDVFTKVNTPKGRKHKPYPRPFKTSQKRTITGQPISVEEAEKKYSWIQKNLNKIKPK